MTEADQDQAADILIPKSRPPSDLLWLVLPQQQLSSTPKIAKQTTKKWAEAAVELEAYLDVVAPMTLIRDLELEARADIMIQSTELHRWPRLALPQQQSQESSSISETNLESGAEKDPVHV
jgi:hypothetical protein